MRIVKPYAELLNIPNTELGIDMLRVIEKAARVSHRSEEVQTADSWRRFLETVVIQHGDWSVVEHVTASVEFLVDRGITHELVRHRLFSYTQESTRFVNYEKKMPPSFVYPNPDVDCDMCLGESGCDNHGFYQNLDGHFVYEHLIAGGSEHGGTQYRCAYDGDWLQSIYEAEVAYKRLLAKGWRPQEARSVFPNALASKIIMTGNLRAWRHFFVMRVSKEAHPQMRQVTIPLLMTFKERIPVLFDDIEVMGRQIDNLRKPQ